MRSIRALSKCASRTTSTGFAASTPLVRASYRASARADTSMFTAIKTASAAVIQGRMRDFSFPMHFDTSG